MLGLTKYVSGRLSIYGNDISIFGRTLLACVNTNADEREVNPSLVAQSGNVGTIEGFETTTKILRFLGGGIISVLNGETA